MNPYVKIPSKALLGLLLTGFLFITVGCNSEATVTKETKSTNASTTKSAAKNVTKKQKLGGAFTLKATTGEVSLSDYKGKVVVLYFGYTSCPDICPTSLAILTAAFQQLDEEAKKEIQPILISLDPERDTPEKLKQYVSYFIPNMIGLTGDLKDIKRIAKNYKVNFRKTDTESAIGYVVDHSSIYFIIGRNGELFTHLMHNSNPTEIAEKIKLALTKK